MSVGARGAMANMMMMMMRRRRRRRRRRRTTTTTRTFHLVSLDVSRRKPAQSKTSMSDWMRFFVSA